MPSSAQEDRQRIESWLLAEFFTDDRTLQFANNPVISGDDLRPMFKNVFANLDMMTHGIKYFDYVPPRIYQAATVRYSFKGDDPEKDIIQIPGFSSLSVKKDNDGKLRCYHADIFLDVSPVFQRIVEKTV
ncbi:Ff.00g133750.m01.CDS01 [Fusarium sp. VM40]|nr:Ff.00g133750.m01.CDS01 [Fusarium sp. VM40]